MQIYVAVTPREIPATVKYHRTLAHIAYCIGEGSSLLRQNILPQTRGGVLSISDRNAPMIKQPEMLCQAVLRECYRRNYHGVLLDFEEQPRPDKTAFVSRLGRLLSINHRTLYLTEPYAQTAQTTVTLVGTAISGGNFSDYLHNAATKGARLALDVERLRMDFCLPARTGLGNPLSKEAFQKLIEQETPTVFFSQDLCARYFTYTQNNETHFVLFDDADTLRQKLKIGSALGYSAAFFMWPEIQDIAEELFGSQQISK